MKDLIKKVFIALAPPILLKSIKKLYWGKYLAKDGMDKKMQKYLDYENGYYVELGANDGIVQSNTYFFEKGKKWKGVLVEPTPNKYFECKTNRSALNHIYCAACVSFDYKDQFVPIAYSNFMSAPMNVESDIENPLEHAKKGGRYLDKNEEVFVFGAKAETLNNLLTLAGAPKVIDFLSLDVEGGELEVLKGIDHTDFRFKYMLIECRDFARLEAYLKEHHYIFIEKLSHHDYLFKQE